MARQSKRRQSKSSKNCNCPLTPQQRRQVKKFADTVDKHKQIARKISPFHL
jgi:hypothetical protein